MTDTASPSPPTAPSTAPHVFDRTLLRQRRTRAAHAGPAHFLREHIVADALERLSAVNRSFHKSLELGGGGVLARALSHTPTPQIGWLATSDLSEALLQDVSQALTCDEEQLPFAEESFDLILAPLSLHTVNDLPGALVQIRRALRPDGLFMGAMLGGDTLTELRQTLLMAEAESGGAGLRVAPFADALDLSQLLQRAGFALPVSDRDRLTVRYDTPLNLIQDLRAMGETAAMTQRSRKPLTRGMMWRAAHAYAERFSDPDGRIRATFEVIWATGWAPHASQQKPLRPGSAQTRLADALGVSEHSAGEKAGR